MAHKNMAPEEWKVFLECPNCGREREFTNTPRKVGSGYQFHINIPKFCIYCEREKEQNEISKR